MAKVFERAHDFHVNNLVVNGSPSGNALQKLKALIAPEALHDSAERCDAPKCDPQTRVALQDDLYSWIEHGDADNPVKMKWVTGPAGSGKTAVMGSVTERCKINGFPVASFFFSSLGSIGRRTKTAFVTTIAYQLAEHRQDLKLTIDAAMEADPIIFKKNLHVQMETLVLAPLRVVTGSSDIAFRGVIVIDGLDECGVEEIHGNTATASRTQPTRTKEEDQLEILRVLHQASSDPTFPFRIIIASRPERVFRHFFDPERHDTPIAQKIDLHQEYDAEADITLFLKVRFDHLRRLHNLPPSWLPPNAIETLVDKASGQFIYAATVIRFLELGHREPPKALLEAILKMEATGTSKPLKTLDELYSHILNSSPDPLLSVLWIRAIEYLHERRVSGSHTLRSRVNIHLPADASDINLLFQTDLASNEAEHLLGNLHSLIRIPPPDSEAMTRYGFYHKSLLDFLKDPDRCGKLHIRRERVIGFLWDRIHGVCARSCGILFSADHLQGFFELLFALPMCDDMSLGVAHSEVLPTPAGVDWYVSMAIASSGLLRPESEGTRAVPMLFDVVHRSCSWYCCKPACRIWSRHILRSLGSFAWIAPCLLWPNRFSGSQRNKLRSLVQTNARRNEREDSESQISADNNDIAHYIQVQVAPLDSIIYRYAREGHLEE